MHGFESLANAVGVSITNFRSSHVLSSRVREYTETGVAITVSPPLGTAIVAGWTALLLVALFVRVRRMDIME